MINIEGKVAVVTGAGRGIGRAIAIELGSLGARVTIAARSVTELEETARTIGSASVFPTDVRKKADIHRLFEHVEMHFGPVDILVNAAGVGFAGNIVDFSDAEYDAILETNLQSVFVASR